MKYTFEDFSNKFSVSPEAQLVISHRYLKCSSENNIHSLVQELQELIYKRALLRNNGKDVNDYNLSNCFTSDGEKVKLTKKHLNNENEDSGYAFISVIEMEIHQKQTFDNRMPEITI